MLQNAPVLVVSLGVAIDVKMLALIEIGDPNINAGMGSDVSHIGIVYNPFIADRFKNDVPANDISLQIILHEIAIDPGCP